MTDQQFATRLATGLLRVSAADAHYLWLALMHASKESGYESSCGQDMNLLATPPHAPIIQVSFCVYFCPQRLIGANDIGGPILGFTVSGRIQVQSTLASQGRVGSIPFFSPASLGNVNLHMKLSMKSVFMNNDGMWKVLGMLTIHRFTYEW